MNNSTQEKNANVNITSETKSILNKIEWKDIGKVSGIYKIINKINGKYYVGSSVNIISSNMSGRWYRHRYNLNKNNHHNDYLQRSWNKYGQNNFDFSIVETIGDIPKLLEIEQKYLDIAKNEQYKCYNLTFKAGGGSPTEYVKNKISKSIRKLGWCGKNSPLFGIKKSKETKINMSKNHANVRGDKNPAFDNTIYRFQHIKTKNIFIGTRYDFYKKYNLRRNGVNQLVYGNYNSTGGWILVGVNNCNS